jgi:5-methyltetrahydrofolate--homocysteine methyltransferase
LTGVPLEELVPFIDWTPFFAAFELKGIYPEILDNVEVGGEAKKLHDDALQVLAGITRGKRLRASAVYGFYPANSVGDDVEVYRDETRTELAAKFHFLRQQIDKAEGRFDHCLADYIAPKETGLKDYLGFFAVTSGSGLDAIVTLQGQARRLLGVSGAGARRSSGRGFR